RRPRPVRAAPRRDMARPPLHVATAAVLPARRPARPRPAPAPRRLAPPRRLERRPWRRRDRRVPLAPLDLGRAERAALRPRPRVRRARRGPPRARAPLPVARREARALRPLAPLGRVPPRRPHEAPPAPRLRRPPAARGRRARGRDPVRRGVAPPRGRET